MNELEKDKIRILMLEDDPADAELILRELGKGKLLFESIRVETKSDFVEKISSFNPHLILSDYSLPNYDGLSALRTVRESYPKIPFILVTGKMGEEWAIDTLKNGATDYILKDRLSRLVPAVKRSLREAQTREDRLNAEIALKKSEEKYRTVADFTYDWEYWINPNGEYLYVSPACERITGYNAEEFIVDPNLFFKIVHPDDRVFIRHHWNEIVNNKSEKCNIEFRIVTKSGETKWIMHSCRPVYNKQGQWLGQRGSNRDYTETKNAEVELRENESRLNTIWNSIQTGIIIIDKDTHRIIDLNNTALEKIGGAKEKIIGELCQKFICPANIGECPITDCGQKVDNSERILINSQGEYVPIIKSVTTINIKGKTQLLETFIDISERKKTEEELRRSKEYLSAIINGMFEGLMVVDKNFLVRDVNEHFLKQYGFKKHDVLNKKCFSVTHHLKEPCGPPDHQCPRCMVFQSKNPVNVEHVHYDARGEELIMELSSFPILDQDGNVELMVEISHDITERKKAESALRESEERFRSLYENSVIGIYRTTPSGKVIMANPALIKMLGYSSFKDLSEVDLNNYGYPEIAKRNEFKKLIQENGKIYGYETEWLRSDGSEVYVSESSKAVYNEKGEIVYYDGTVEDITEKKKALKELENYKNHLENLVNERTSNLKEVNSRLENEIEKQKFSEAKIQNQLSFLKILIDTIPNPIFIKDETKRLTDVNKAFEEFTGKNKSELIGNVFNIDSGNNGGKTQEFFDNELLLKPDRKMYESEIINGTGEKKTVIINKATFTKSDNSIGGIVGVIMDITERKKLEEKIINALEKEKELNELKTRFLSTSSHEFRTPLTSILASTDLLEMFGRNWKEEKYFEHISKIQNAVNHMTELLDDVLKISRAEEGKITFSPARFNIDKLCSRLLEDAKINSTPKHFIKYKFHGKRKEVVLDEKLLRQILQNLLANAVKYSPGGGEINFCVHVNKTAVKFKISDEGIGIGETDIKQLYEPFHRGDNIGTIPGTGLGLSIVKKSVELHGGEIFVESRLDKGTTFTIKLPERDN